MIEVIYLDPARDEMIEAARWYDDQQRGVGGEFLDEVDRAIDRLLFDPEARPTLAANVFRQRVDRFPFDLVYQSRPNQIVIVAAAHHSRKPAYWRRRNPRGSR